MPKIECFSMKDLWFTMKVFTFGSNGMFSPLIYFPWFLCWVATCVKCFFWGGKFHNGWKWNKLRKLKELEWGSWTSGGWTTRFHLCQLAPFSSIVQLFSSQLAYVHLLSLFEKFIHSNYSTSLEKVCYTKLYIYNYHTNNNNNSLCSTREIFFLILIPNNHKNIFK
jgi:hypothetical protein